MDNEGSFVPQVQHDILVEIIGIKEHNGCVRGDRQDINLRVYFATSRKSKELCKKEMNGLIDKNLEKKIRTGAGITKERAEQDL